MNAEPADATWLFLIMNPGMFSKTRCQSFTALGSSHIFVAGFANFSNSSGLERQLWL